MEKTVVTADSPTSPRPAAAAEAAVLLAIATCPVLVIPFANNPFEPHKAAFLWTMTAAACAAVACAPVVGWRRLRELDGWSRVVLVGLACAVAGLCISAARSDGPSLAWWGSTLRRYGALTQVSMLAVLGATLLFATDTSTLDRLITALILGSVGPTVYAIAQALQLDPLIWDQGRSQGNSTFGNWLFCAGYVATTWPLTLGRALIVTRRAFRDQRERTRSLATWTLLGLQSAALAAAGSRGPLLALVVTSVMAGIAMLLLHGRRVPGAILAGLVAVAVVLFLLIAPPRMAAAPARASEAVSMPVSNRSAVVRLILWDAVARGLKADSAAGMGALLFGSGPESTTRLVTRYGRPGLELLHASPDIVADRAHNDTLETLATAGLIGLLLRLVILGASLGVALVGLGLLERSQTGVFATFEIVVLCGAVALAVWRGGGLWALAVAPPAAVVLVIAGWMAWRPVKVTPRDTEISILLAAAIAACVVHFIEIQLSLATVGSALTASVAMAVVLSLAAAARDPGGGAGVSPSRISLRPPSDAVPVLVGWSAAVLMIGLAGPSVEPSLSASLIATVAWLLSLAVVGANPRGVAVSGMTWAGVCAVWFLWQASPAATISVDEAADALAARLPLFYVAALVCLVGVTGLLAAGRERWRHGVVSVAASLAAGGFAATMAVRMTGADVYAWSAARCAQRGDYRCALAQYRNAADRGPTNDQVLTQLAMTLMAQTDATSDPASADVLLAEAERALGRAQAFDPFDYHHPRNLAALRRSWARRAPQTARAAHLDEADRLYRTSTDLAPSNGVLWAEWANLDAERLQPGDAFTKLERAASLGAVSEAILVADALLQATGENMASPASFARVAAHLEARGCPVLADLYARRSTAAGQGPR